MVLEDNSLSSQIWSQLLCLPSRFPDDPSENLKTTVHRLLHFSLSSNGQFYQQLFPNIDTSSPEFPKSFNDVILDSYTHVNLKGQFYKRQKPSTNKSHKGRICARQIPDGAQVYHCHDCGVDPTCCMCADCFNREKHKDHNVSVGEASGGAICDCGDHSSWNAELNCLANSRSSDYNVMDLPLQLRENIDITVTSIIDFFITVQTENYQTLPYFQSMLDNEIYASSFKKLLNTRGGDDSNNFLMICWNDEFHSYPVAGAGISRALGISGRNSKAEEIAGIVDARGIAKIKQSDSIADLLTSYWALRNGPSHSSTLPTVNPTEGLTGSIISYKDWINYTIVEEILNWLETITKHPDIRISEYCKIAITNTFLGKYISPLPINHNKLTIYDSYKNTVGLLTPDYKIPYISFASLDKSKLISLEQLQLEGLKMLERSPPYINDKTASTTRLQIIFYLDIRLWKLLRKKIKLFLIPILTSNQDSRLNFAKQIIEILPALEHMNVYLDREWNLSLLDHFRLQVYHDPTIGTVLLKEGLLYNAFASCLNVFKCSSDGLDKYQPSEDLTDWKSARTRDVQATVLRGLATLISFIQPQSEELFHYDILLFTIMILELFHESYSIERKLGEHVERENMNYESHFFLGTTVYKLTKNLGKIASTFNKKPNKYIEDAISILNSYIFYGERPPIDEDGLFMHKVAYGGGSFLHPLHSYLAELCTNYQFFEFDMLRRAVCDIDLESKELYFDIDQSVDELDIADDVLQSFVLTTQIDSRFWVRNGSSVDSQCEFNKVYFNFEGDLYLNQLGIILEPDPLRALKNILDRFEVYDCFKEGANKELDSTIFEEKIGNILLGLIEFFYNLLSFRVPFDSSLQRSDLEYLKTKTLVEYALTVHPMKYSEISEQYNSEPFFADAFKEVSEYIPPTGVTDYGRYSLKASEYLKIDPINILNKFESIDDIENSLYTEISRLKKKKEEDIVLIPQLHKLLNEDLINFKPIGTMMKTKLFAKFIYKCLNFAINSGNDVYLPQLLHLLYGIMLDDGLYTGDDDDSHGLANFVDIPIGNLLLTLIEKDDVSKTIAKKASSILDMLLLKDDNVLPSLIDCFGQTHIDDFKKSKHGKNFETKKERIRRLALKRQQKILKKMNKQQEKFIENNKKYFKSGETLHENDEYEDEKSKLKHNHNEELRNCILCKNTENYNEVFGLPAMIVQASAFWNLPTIDMNPPKLMIDEFNDVNVHDRNTDLCLGVKNTKSKYVISGCSHGMHYTCFTEMLHEKKAHMAQFKCPLCNNFCNAFIPTFRLPMDRFEVYLDGYLRNDGWQNVFDNQTQENCYDLSSLIFDRELFHILTNSDGEPHKKIISELKHLYKENTMLVQVANSNPNKIVGVGHSISMIIGNTLEMLQISTRGQPKDKQVIPEMSLTLLRSLIQFKVLLNYTKRSDDEDKIQGLKDYYSWQNIGFITEVITLFLQGNESFEILLKLSSAKWCLQSCFSILLRRKQDERNLVVDSILPCPVAKPINEDVKLALSQLLKRTAASIFSTFLGEVKVQYYDNLIVEQAYKILFNVYQNYKEQFELVKQLFNIADGEMDSLDEVILWIKDSKSLEYSVFIQLAETSESYRSTDNSLAIDFPGKVHLDNLPIKLSDITTLKDLAEDEPTDAVICLLCGKLVKTKSHQRHINHCSMNESGYGIFFSPFKNKLEVEVIGRAGHNAFMDISLRQKDTSIGFGSPYLNQHGEPAGGLIGNGDSGTLDPVRYDHLNKMWLNQHLISSIYRELYKKMLQEQRARLEIPANFFNAFGGNLGNIANLRRLAGLANMTMNGVTMMDADEFDNDDEDDILEDSEDSDGTGEDIQMEMDPEDAFADLFFRRTPPP